MRKLLVLAFVLAGCQTGAPTEPAKVPVVLQPLFETCEPNDGAMTLQIFKSGGIVTSLDLVWKAKELGAWELEVANAAGQTLAHVARNGAGITAEGKAADKLPEVTVLKDGFLAVDGEPVGLKASEVPCILGFRLPRSWIALVRGVETDGRITHVEMGDERRDLVLTVKDAAEDTSAVCTRISWSKFLIFRTKISWCQTPNAHGGPSVKKRQAVLSGLGDYQLKWVSADE